MMTRTALLLAACLIVCTVSGETARTHAAGTAAPTVSALVLDAAGNSVGGSSVSAGMALHAEITVSGSAGAPSGGAQTSAYSTPDCSGTATADGDAMLADIEIPSAHSIDLSNAAGDDSATTWVGNGAGYVATNWAGALFAGNDLANFASSSMGWLFRGMPLARGDQLDHAYLVLRIRKSRPNSPQENAGTWTTNIRASTSGDALDQSSRAAFLAQFDSPPTGWSMRFSAAVPDPFATGDGQSYAASPDIARAVAARLAAPTWIPGGNIAVGVLNAGTVNIAEAEVVDQPDYARLRLEWTTYAHVERAESPAWTAAEGALSVRAHYGGDAMYAPADSACIALTVGPKDSDADGYSDAAEIALGRDPFTYCAIMRADVDASGSVAIIDLALVARAYGQSIPPADARYDQDASRDITIIDLARMAAVYGRPVSACP